MSEPTTLRFDNDDVNSREFNNTLQKRVNQYFKDKGISKYGNMEMYIKTFFMLSLFLMPFFAIVIFQPSGVLLFSLVSMVGLGMAGIGLSVMHDGVHGAYSSNKTVNKFWGYTANLIGANALNWKLQHNIKHHTYPNIEEYDEDIAPKLILRLSPYSKQTGVHRFQFIYGWMLYALGTFFWVTFKDFVKFIIYYKEGILQKNVKSVAAEILILVGSKVLYYLMMFGIPLTYTSYTFGQIFLGFFVGHLVAGLALAAIFQPSHLMEEVEYPLPDENGKMPYSRIVHQLYTSVNFANSNRLVTWYGGGLNFQIEHHLFPHICHVHYPAVSKILMATAKEYGIPYHAKEGFFEALYEHTKMLKWLGSPASNLSVS
jgi:linoleoyl-CoA desaturase